MRLRVAGLATVAILTAACGSAVSPVTHTSARNDAGMSAPATIGSNPFAPTSGGLQAAPAPQLTSDKASSPGAPATIPLGTPVGQQIERSVTASYTVPHGRFLDAFNAALAQAADFGGYVVQSNTSPDLSGDIVSGSITLKVPQDKLSAFLSGLPTYFQTSSVNFSSIDHTNEFVDVNAELAAVQAHHDVLVKLLANAATLADTISIEQQIADVERQLNQLQGQMDGLKHAVAYSTATLSLSERGVVTVAPKAPSALQPLADSFFAGLANARDVVAAAIAALLTVAPMLLVLLLAWLTRRRWLPRLGSRTA